jgi:catechol 2,3-dioxygenase-like lactoylglutathione lyase family enzyme
MTQASEGALPKGGFSPFKPELHVNDLTKSRAFWEGIVGFTLAYEREAERFVYLEHSGGAQLMLCQRHADKKWETGPMEYPLGQGVMFQLEVDTLAPVLDAIEVQNYPIYRPVREVWRKIGDRMGGQREVFLLDPDGYLIMIEESLGERPLAD